jgi:hypothetical protein
MSPEDERRELERQLARYRELALEFPTGPINDVLRDLIGDLERQIDLLKPTG